MKNFSEIRKSIRAAFTLAEVLITLAIIGVVAAMTIPTLIAKINDIVNTNTVKVFNSKVLKGINLTKTAGDLNDTYDTTYQFLTDALSKNLKMAKICDADHIRDCIPYDKIKYEDKSGNEKTVNVSDLKTASKLNLKAPYTDTAAFVLGDGTPVIVAYNTKCIDDPDKAYTSLTDGCLAGVFDINGSRKPNKYLAKVDEDNTSYVGDLRPFNGASIGSSCAGTIGDVCIVSTAKVANASLVAEIQAVDPSYTLPKTSPNNYDDYWQVANDYCEKIGGGSLPDSTALAKIANALYGVDNISTANSYNSNSSLSWDANKDTVFAALGITDNPSWFTLWSSSPNGTEHAYYRYFNSSGTGYDDYVYRDNYGQRVVCLGS